VDFAGSPPPIDTAVDAVLPDAVVVDAGVPDAPVVDAAISDSLRDAPQVPDSNGSLDAEPSLDACVPITCNNHATCDYGDYCGTIGDGCGGTLDCDVAMLQALSSPRPIRTARRRCVSKFRA
jgi:hypothetical protein